MRELNSKQKELIDTWCTEYDRRVTLNFNVERDMDCGILWELEELNDFETLYQAITSYVHEKAMERSKC